MADGDGTRELGAGELGASELDASELDAPVEDGVTPKVIVGEVGRFVMNEVCDRAKVAVARPGWPLPRAGPTELMIAGLSVDEMELDAAMVPAEAGLDGGVEDVIVLEEAAEVVAELLGWLLSGHVNPLAQGSMEQQPLNAFSAQEWNRNPEGQSSTSR